MYGITRLREGEGRGARGEGQGQSLSFAVLLRRPCQHVLDLGEGLVADAAAALSLLDTPAERPSRVTRVVLEMALPRKPRKQKKKNKGG